MKNESAGPSDTPESQLERWIEASGPHAFQAIVDLNVRGLGDTLDGPETGIQCLRCAKVTPVGICSNCGSTAFRFGLNTIVCARCGTGSASYKCECGCVNPVNFQTYRRKAKASSGGGCFIATAALGSASAPDTLILRDFRDRVLLRSTPGEAFIRLYYSVSPPVASLIGRSASLRWISRTLLVRPVALFARYWMT